MSVAQSLRYYRGQFNPEQIYQGQGQSSGPEIYSMYNPQAEQQFMQAVGQRQERFDATNMAYAAEKARIGEMDTYNLAGLTKQLGNFEGKIKEVVRDKYNGDWGAAANEVARMIGTERSNPFYHYNKQQVEVGKTYLEDKRRLGSNFMSTNNPLEITFEEWQQGKPMEYTPVNREDIVKQAAIEFGSIADTIINDPELRLTAGGQYLLSTIQTGLKDPTQLMEYLQSEEGSVMVDNIKANNPTLGKLPQDQVMDAIVEGAHSAIGKTQTQYLANQDYIDPVQKANIDGSNSTGYLNVITQGNGIATGKLIKDDKDGQRLSGIRSYKINTLAPWRMSAKQQNELETLTTTLSTVVKDLILTDTPNQHVGYLSKPSEKNLEKMERSKDVKITDIAFDPESTDLILGIQGEDKDNNALEAGITLNFGTDNNPNTDAFNMLAYLHQMGGKDSNFNKDLSSWIVKYFPNYYKQMLQ